MCWIAIALPTNLAANVFCGVQADIMRPVHLKRFAMLMAIGSEKTMVHAYVLNTLIFSAFSLCNNVFLFHWGRIEYPTPILECPPEMIAETSVHDTMGFVKITKPKTDVNWDRDVTATPGAAKHLSMNLAVGTSNITFTARHPLSKLSVSCSFLVTVLGSTLWTNNNFTKMLVLLLAILVFQIDGEPPAVQFCPKNQHHTLNRYDDSVQIAWTEPYFTDNVNVTNVSKTNVMHFT